LSVLFSREMSLEAHERIVEAMEVRHREDLAKMSMQLAVYRQALEAAGVEPPDAEGEDLLRMLRECAAVVSTASEFAAGLGSARELLDNSWLLR